MTFLVRPAAVADAARLSELAVTTFQDAFAKDNTPDDMARYIAAAFSPERQAAEIADREGIMLVAARDGTPGDVELVGYTHLVWAPAPEAVRGPAPMELKRMYVARAWHGQGLAQSLMSAALDAARDRGARTVWLGVWERNPRAIAFYAKYGFARVGEHTFVLGADAQTDWLMARSLDDLSSIA